MSCALTTTMSITADKDNDLSIVFELYALIRFFVNMTITSLDPVNKLSLYIDLLSDSLPVYLSNRLIGYPTDLMIADCLPVVLT